MSQMSQDVLKEIGRELADAKECSSMVAIFRIDEENKLRLYRMTNNFPTAYHNESVKLLKENLDEIGKPHPLGGTKG